MACTNTLPRSWTGTPGPFQPTASDRATPTPIRSANAPKACKPTWPTTCEPTLSTATFLVLVAFTSEMPFCSG